MDIIIYRAIIVYGDFGKGELEDWMKENISQ